jgi:SpoIID/LytB domain protein
MGVAGSSTEEILAAFYPGTTIGTGGGTLNVGLDKPRPDVELAFPSGGDIRDAPSGPQSPGFPITVAAGGSVRISSDGALAHAFPLGGATPAAVAPTPTTAPPTTAAPLLGQVPAPTSAPASTAPPPPPAEPTTSRPLWAVPAEGSLVAVGGVGQYRGVIEATPSGTDVELVNRLDVEQYLRGMGEIRDPGWPAASLQSQAIAARTYAVRSLASGQTLCSTDQCQVYLGESAEYPAMDAAVEATSGQVLRYGGALADTVYSASGGGFSATPEEGFGGGEPGAPYLRAAPYPTLDPQPWTERSTLAEMAGKFGYSGAVKGAHVTRTGPSGRALEVVFEGDAGPMAVDGQRFQSVLKLRSTLFTLRIEEPPPPPPPPPGAPEGVAGPQQVRVAAPPPRAMTALGAPQPLNRRPWIALALVLLIGSASAASRVRSAGIAASATAGPGPVDQPKGPLGT